MIRPLDPDHRPFRSLPCTGLPAGAGWVLGRLARAMAEVDPPLARVRGLLERLRRIGPTPLRTEPTARPRASDREKGKLLRRAVRKLGREAWSGRGATVAPDELE